MRRPGDDQAWDMVMRLLRWHRHLPPECDQAMVMCLCGLTATSCEILAAGRDSGVLPPLAQLYEDSRPDGGAA